jgi:hypothetical protein
MATFRGSSHAHQYTLATQGTAVSTRKRMPKRISSSSSSSVCLASPTGLASALSFCGGEAAALVPARRGTSLRLPRFRSTGANKVVAVSTLVSAYRFSEGTSDSVRHRCPDNGRRNLNGQTSLPKSERCRAPTALAALLDPPFEVCAAGTLHLPRTRAGQSTACCCWQARTQCCRRGCVDAPPRSPPRLCPRLPVGHRPPAAVATSLWTTGSPLGGELSTVDTESI